MSQQQDVHEQNPARAATPKAPEADTKELALTDEQKSFINSNLPAVMTREAL